MCVDGCLCAYMYIYTHILRNMEMLVGQKTGEGKKKGGGEERESSECHMPRNLSLFHGFPSPALFGC